MNIDVTKFEEELEISNNELARMIAAGFSNMATKDDIVAVREEIKEVLEHILVVDERVTTVQQGMVPVSEHLYLEKRVDTLEETVKKLVKKPQLGY